MMKKMLALLMLAGLSGIAQAKMVKEQLKEQKKESSEAVECLVNELPKLDESAKNAVRRKKCKCFCCVTTNKLLVNGDATVTGTLTANNLVADIESVSGDFSVGGTLTVENEIVGGNITFESNILADPNPVLNAANVSQLLATLSFASFYSEASPILTFANNPILFLIPGENSGDDNITFDSSDKVTVRDAGIYEVSWTYADSATPNTALQLYVNDIAVLGAVNFTGAANTPVSGSYIVAIGAGETVVVKPLLNNVTQSYAVQQAFTPTFIVKQLAKL